MLTDVDANDIDEFERGFDDAKQRLEWGDFEDPHSKREAERYAQSFAESITDGQNCLETTGIDGERGFMFGWECLHDKFLSDESE